MTPSSCGACRKSIVSATMDGKSVSVVRVAMGTGTIALTPSLFDQGKPSAIRVSRHTGYELHRCKGLASFTKAFHRRAVR